MLNGGDQGSNTVQSTAGKGDTVEDALKVCGSSLRLAIKQSLSVDNGTLFPHNDTGNHRVTSKKVSQRSSTGQKDIRNNYTANPTIINMWTSQLSVYTSNASATSDLVTVASRTDSIQPGHRVNLLNRLPVEVLSIFIPSYLTVIELCAFRATCRSAWTCVCTHAFDRNVIALCQGQYNALCEPTGMLTEREYEMCGFVRPKWPHAHNEACQLCGAGEVGLGDYFCSSCNVVCHRACLLQDLSRREDGQAVAQGMLGLQDGLASQAFFCLECSTAREAPVCGYALLLPLSDISSSGEERVPPPSPEPGNLTVDASPTPVTGGGSLRVAIRESIREQERLQAAERMRQRHLSTQRAHCRDMRRRWAEPGGVYQSRRRVWWDECSTGHHSGFRVAGGFHSSSLKPSRDLLAYVPPSRGGNSGAVTGSGQWQLHPCLTSFKTSTESVPIIHSEMACVVGRTDGEYANYPPAQYEVWTFPQRRDSTGGQGSGQGKEVCFHRACVLQPDSCDGDMWTWRDLGGHIPCPRTGAAFCYSPLLRGLLLHGGMAVLSNGGQVIEREKSPGPNPKRRRSVGWHYLEEKDSEVGDGNEGVAWGGPHEDSKHRAACSTVFAPVSTLHFLNTGPQNDHYPPGWVGGGQWLDMWPSKYSSHDTCANTDPGSTCASWSTARGTSCAPLNPSLSSAGNDSADAISTPVRQKYTKRAHYTTWPSPTTSSPSPRHGHSISEIGGTVWLFGGMGADLVHAEGSRARRSQNVRRHLNDLYALDVRPTLSASNSSKMRRKSSLQWTMPQHNGTPPRRRAGHTAVALGPQLIICGGANGTAYMMDVHILHTPTVTWSTVNLQSVCRPVSAKTPGSPHTSESVQDIVDTPSGCCKSISWDSVVSKRIRPSLLPVSPNRVIVFGGGRAADAAIPHYKDIPTDCFIITLQAQSRPAHIM